MNTKYNLQSFETDDLLFEAIANFIIDIAHKAVAEKGEFVIALSGGNTPNRLYSLLTTDKFSHQMPWKNTFVFWGDELIELDESMSLVPELCDECKLLGYCKKTKEKL